MSIGYQLEQLATQGDRDRALYLAETTLDDVLAFYIEDGYDDADLLELLNEHIAAIRREL